MLSAVYLSNYMSTSPSPLWSEMVIFDFGNVTMGLKIQWHLTDDPAVAEAWFGAYTF